jgi:hypothetical protein
VYVFDHDDAVDVLAISTLVSFVVDPEVVDSTKICYFVTNLVSKMLASVSHLHALLEEIHVVGVIVLKTTATKDIQVDLDPRGSYR